jgi:hypothetical protein
MMFDVWKARFQAHIGREQPSLFKFTQSLTDRPSAEDNSIFACHLLPFVADELITRYRHQLSVISQGVEFYRAICEHFTGAAPPDDLGEELFLRGFRGLFRDKFATVADFMRESQSLLLSVERATGNSAPAIERLIVMHTLQQLCVGSYCPWAPSLMAKYRSGLRESSSLNSIPEPFTLKQLISEVASHTTSEPGSRDSLAAGRYSTRPLCERCKRYGHHKEQCRVPGIPSGNLHRRRSLIIAVPSPSRMVL